MNANTYPLTAHLSPGLLDPAADSDPDHTPHRAALTRLMLDLYGRSPYIDPSGLIGSSPINGG